MIAEPTSAHTPRVAMSALPMAAWPAAHSPSSEIHHAADRACCTESGVPASGVSARCVSTRCLSTGGVCVSGASESSSVCQAATRALAGSRCWIHDAQRRQKPQSPSNTSSTPPVCHRWCRCRHGLGWRTCRNAPRRGRPRPAGRRPTTDASPTPVATARSRAPAFPTGILVPARLHGPPSTSGAARPGRALSHRRAW